MALKDLEIRALKPRDKVYKQADERGLHIEVHPGGSKLWRMKFRFLGRDKRIAFGSYPEVGLAEARRRRDEARQQVRGGIDPTAERRREKLLAMYNAANTFGDVAEEYIITTDRRVYHIQLESTRSTAMAALSWTYPGDELIALQRSSAAAEAAAPVAAGLAVENLRFGYTIGGDNPPWRPLRAFDDGRQTFIEFPATIAQGEAPPLFVVGERGQAELVNYRMSGRYYVVDRLFARAELRLGAQRQAVVRISRDDARRGQRRRRAS